MRTSAVRWLALGAIAALALTGCGSDKATKHAAAKTSASVSAHPSASASGSVRPSASASPHTLLTVSMPTGGLSDPQKPVAAVVLSYWQRYSQAVSTRDLKASGLSKLVTTASGTDSTEKVVDSLKSKDQLYKGTLTLTVRSIGFGGDTATVDACVDQSKSKLVDANGKAIAEPEKQNVLPIAHTLVRRGNTWLVDKLQQGGFTC